MPVKRREPRDVLFLVAAYGSPLLFVFYVPLRSLLFEIGSYFASKSGCGKVEDSCYFMAAAFADAWGAYMLLFVGLCVGVSSVAFLSLSRRPPAASLTRIAMMACAFLLSVAMIAGAVMLGAIAYVRPLL